MRVFLLAAFFLSVGTLFGQDLFGFRNNNPAIDFGTQVTDADVLQLVTILENKTWDSKTSPLAAIAKKLPLNTKYALYEKYKVAGAWGFLNVYGVGSFFQGDPATSIITLGGYGAGIAATIASHNLSGSSRDLWAATGGIIGAGAFVYGMVRPWFFAEEKNNKLRAALFTTD